MFLQDQSFHYKRFMVVFMNSGTVTVYPWEPICSKWHSFPFLFHLPGTWYLFWIAFFISTRILVYLITLSICFLGVRNSTKRLTCSRKFIILRNQNLGCPDFYHFIDPGTAGLHFFMIMLLAEVRLHVGFWRWFFTKHLVYYYMYYKGKNDHALKN